MGKKIVYSMTPERTSKSLTHAELAFAGFFSAVPTTFVAAPVERVKVLLQVRLSLLLKAGDPANRFRANVDAGTGWTTALQRSSRRRAQALRAGWDPFRLPRNGRDSCPRWTR